jgi:hypothetical protein
MASQAVSGSGLEVFDNIRGYHAYIGLWTPTIGEVLLVKPEPTNEKDSNAVAVLKEDSIVGHVPQNLSLRLFHFLRRDVNKAFAEVTGQKVNRPFWGVQWNLSTAGLRRAARLSTTAITHGTECLPYILPLFKTSKSGTSPLRPTATQRVPKQSVAS